MKSPSSETSTRSQTSGSELSSAEISTEFSYSLESESELSCEEDQQSNHNNTVFYHELLLTFCITKLRNYTYIKLVTPINYYLIKYRHY